MNSGVERALPASGARRPDETDAAEIPGRGRRERLLVVAVGLAAALPVIVGIFRAAADDWTPLGDNAMVATARSTF